MLQLILLVFAFVLLSIGAYLAPEVHTKLTRVGLALIALVYVLNISHLVR